jgi:hypothetical protein
MLWWVTARMGNTNEERPCVARHVARWRTRCNTPLYRLKTASHRSAEVLTALAEGLSVSAAVQLFGHRHATITTWLTHPGAHSAMLHDRFFQNLTLPHLQLDELRTRLRSRVPALWLWVVVDPLTKIIPVLKEGARTQAAAHAVVHELRGRLAPDCLPVFTSDGLNHYFYALTSHFGQWVASVGQRARRWLLRSGADLRAGEKNLPVPEVGAGHARDALRDTRCPAGCAHQARAEWAVEYGLCRAGQEGRCGKTWRPSSAGPGRHCRRRRSFYSIWSGGGHTITSCGHMCRSSKRWPARSTVVESARGSASASESWRWRPA